ncbi:MAG: hypothetical protein HRT52_12515 [Colwellia sp.]|nr:hypothetical protein [Colwellia sp.]
MEVIIIIAGSTFLWLCWQLIQAKKFTKFKQRIEQEIKPQVIERIIANLDQQRSDLFPNNDCHQRATIYYWTQYKSRILKVALQQEIIDKQWLKDTGNWRNSQHLFHIEQDLL